jgi:maltose phosphorylase
MAKVQDRYLVVDPWKIVEDGFHPEKSRVSESLFSLSNEHMGVRGYFEEEYSGDTLIGCYLNGIYEEHALKEPTTYKGISNRIAFMVNTVNWLHARIELDGEFLDLNRSRFDGFRRELDFRTGQVSREFTWTTKVGHAIKVRFSRLLSMKTNELGFGRISFTPLNFSGPIAVTLGLDFSLRHEMYKRNFWDCPQAEASADRWAILGVSKNIKLKLFAGSRLISTGSVVGEPVRRDKFAGSRLTLDLVQGHERHLDRATVLFTTRNPKDGAAETWTAGARILDNLDGEQAGYDKALDENRAYWTSFWDKADISIDGDPEAQQGIRFCIFQMQQTYRGAVEGSNIGAKGLTGEAYNGNAFWDTETYCLPYYLFSNPVAAKALIDFRFRTLPQAEERAHSLDCAGACYPIATTDGTESCTLWQHASLQFQPTTGVAYAIWHYARVTGDLDFLHTEGIELLIPICRFLASRGQWSPRRNGFGYYAVMGPDEFQMMVNNNCYTNFMAKQTFLYTLTVLADMEKDAAGARDDVMQKLACTAEELTSWRNMADHMIIPVDPATGVYEQHEGFFDLPHIDVDAIPVEDFPLYHNWSYDRIYRNDMIKQPDVLMFMFLYSQSFSLAQKRANYDYYEPRCIHESSLSPSLHSIFAAELGRQQEAFEFFRFATRIDLDNYNRNTAEGIHITSIAAAWMNVVYGYGGMRSDGDLLVFNPTIPEHWQSYSFRVSYRDSIVRVSVSQTEARIELMAGAPFAAFVRGEVREINTEGLVLAQGRA